MTLGIVLLVAPLVLLTLYILLNNSRVACLPKEAAAFNPTRLTPQAVRDGAAQLASSPPITINNQLPPKTGRRYIVVGGAGFLGGWVVSSLLERGEDPRCIRMLDIRPPVREDLIKAQSDGVQFIQVDVSDADAVEAAFSAPWPPAISLPNGSLPELTVFHTAANIRFYERHEMLLPNSDKVNAMGTENVVSSAGSAGASVFVYTSSGSIAVHRSRFFLWPWEKEPPQFVQIINDDDDRLPQKHGEFFSNYAVSKRKGDRIVTAADKSPSGSSIMRTGCIRPGNGVFGPRGDMLCGAYLARQTNPTWIYDVLQSFCYVENCVLAHLCYEQRLIELHAGSKNPDIGGQAFNIADPGPIPTYGDVYTVLETMSEGECKFPKLPLTVMLLLAHGIEWYYLTRIRLVAAGYKKLANMLSPIAGDLINLQPSLFALTSVHLIFDDSRARLPPEKGGLGYKGAWTTFEGLYKTVKEHQSGTGASWRSELGGVSLGFRRKLKKPVAVASVKPLEVTVNTRVL